MGEGSFDKLRKEVAEGRVVFVVGAGVSIGATGGDELAGWQGLVRHGVRRCAELLGSKLPRNWSERQFAALESSDPDDVLGVAERVERKLRGLREGVFDAWLSETVGALRATDSSVLEALHASGCPIATTNHDDLLSTTELRPITWLSGGGAHASDFARNDSRSILHLHGHWNEPKSIVLGLRSYSDILKNDLARHAARTLATSKTLVFVGCGSGLEDPYFESLRTWIEQSLYSAKHTHYRLALSSDLSSLQVLHGTRGIHVVPFGSKQADLASFLHSFGSGQSSQLRSSSIQSARSHSTRLDPAVIVLTRIHGCILH